MSPRLALAASLALLAACGSTGPQRLSAYPVPPLEAFEFTDPEAWHLGFTPEGFCLELKQAADYAPPHRSPRGLALFQEHRVGSFVLEVMARSTGRNYGHRDLCLVFGYQDPANYYYVHLAPAPDQNAHNVFLVDDAPRRNLLPVQPSGMEWDDHWHHLRLERDLTTGRIAVYVDHAEAPILEATDTTHGPGLIGLGSFDDTGQFRDLHLWTP